MYALSFALLIARQGIGNAELAAALGGWLFHHRLNAGAIEVPSRQCQSQQPSKCLSSHPLDIVTAASSAMSLWFTGQRQAEPSCALRGEPPIGTGLTLKVGLETLVRLDLGHPLTLRNGVFSITSSLQRTG
jgi:hypothetical protein